MTQTKTGDLVTFFACNRHFFGRVTDAVPQVRVVKDKTYHIVKVNIAGTVGSCNVDASSLAPAVLHQRTKIGRALCNRETPAELLGELSFSAGTTPPCPHCLALREPWVIRARQINDLDRKIRRGAYRTSKRELKARTRWQRLRRKLFGKVPFVLATSDDRTLALYWLTLIETSGYDERDEHYQAEHRREIAELPEERLRARASELLHRAGAIARNVTRLSSGEWSCRYSARFWGALAGCYALAGGGWGRYEPGTDHPLLGRWVGTPGPTVHPLAGSPGLAEEHRKVRAEMRAWKQHHWSRVVYVKDAGYDCDETETGRGWSEHQRHATKRSKAEAHTRAKEFRARGAIASVIRLRPKGQ